MPPPPGPNDLTRQQLDELDALLQRMLGLPLDPPPEPAPRPPKVEAEPLPLPDLPAGWRLDGGHLHKPDPHAGVPLSPAMVPMLATGAVAELAPDFRRPPVVEAEADDDDPYTRFGPPTEGTGLPTGPFAYAPVPVAANTPGTLRGVDAPALPSDFRLATVPDPEPAAGPELEPLPNAAAGGLDYRKSPVQTRIVTAAHLEPPAAKPAPLGPALWPLAAANWVLETLLGLAGPAGALAVRPAGKRVLGVLGVLLLAAAAAWTARGLGLVDFPVPARPAWTAR